jgi:hypothetical protein
MNQRAAPALPADAALPARALRKAGGLTAEIARGAMDAIDAGRPADARGLLSKLADKLANGQV